MSKPASFSDLDSKHIAQGQFIEMLKQLAHATKVMRGNVEEIDLRLKEAHEMPMAA